MARLTSSRIFQLFISQASISSHIPGLPDFFLGRGRPWGSGKQRFPNKHRSSIIFFHFFIAKEMKRAHVRKLGQVKHSALAPQTWNTSAKSGGGPSVPCKSTEGETSWRKLCHKTLRACATIVVSTPRKLNVSEHAVPPVPELLPAFPRTEAPLCSIGRPSLSRPQPSGICRPGAILRTCVLCLVGRVTPQCR